MNKYDDIKRFIEKSKTEHIDYKEINETSTGNGMTGSMNQWPLIKQVSASDDVLGTLDNGRTTQPTPQAISAEEFQRSTPVTHEVINATGAARFTAPATPSQPLPATTFSSAITPAVGGLMEALRESLPVAAARPQPVSQTHVPHSTAILHAQPVTPDNTGSLLDSVKQVLPVQPATPVFQPAYTAPATPVAAPFRPAAAPAALIPATPVPGEQFRQMFKQKAPPLAGAFLHRDTPLQPLLEMIASCR